MQVRRYGDLPRSASQLSELCSKPGREQDITPDSKFQWRGDLPVVAFGKYSGTYQMCYRCLLLKCQNDRRLFMFACDVFTGAVCHNQGGSAAHFDQQYATRLG
jgi:hypothetical protein